MKFLKSFATRTRLGGSSHLVSPSGLFSPPPAKPDFSLAFPWRYCPGPSGGSPGSWRGALPRLAAALLLVLAASLAIFAVLALGVPGEAQAQTVTTFISNTGQADSGSSSLSNATYYYAQRFTTGSNPGGYSLSEVVVSIDGSSATHTPAFAIHQSTTNSSSVEVPGSEVVGLTGSVAATGLQGFTPDSATTLMASTKYFVVFHATGTGTSPRIKRANAGVDAGFATGWEIPVGTRWSGDSASTWTVNATTRSFKIQIKGTLGTTVANTAATGEPTITGTAQVGETLTAVTTGIMDANGLTSATYTYQWIRVNGSDADIAGANSSTYTLDAADLGKTIKVKVSFTDDASNTETLTSAETATVTAATVTPVSAALVSNIGQTGSDFATLESSDAAQPFTTGTNATGYTLTSIELRLNSILSTDTPTVKLYSGSANGTEVATFTGPAMLDATGTNNYPAFLTKRCKK